MGWYYGTFSCGHQGRVEVVGRGADRQWKVDKKFAGLCPDCQEKKREEELKKAIAASAEYEFPELSGTQRQIDWAIAIRMAFYEACDKRKIDTTDIIRNETTARFWIDNRDLLRNPMFILSYNQEHKIKKIQDQYQEQMVNDDMVKPAEIKHDGVVEIVEKNGYICLKYEKNNDFIALVKSMRYSWKENVWCRKLVETVGTFDDRAAEAGHKLLENGFCISIHDEEIKEKAVSGDYEPEHDRWIISVPNSSQLAVMWVGFDDELYSRARKIKGSEWKNHRVCVDVSNYEEIVEFAKENDFRFTSKAKRKIKDYAGLDI